VRLVDDLKMPLSDEERERRAFLGLLTGGAFAAAAAGTGITAIRFMWPEVLFEQETRFRLARPETIAVGTVLVLPEQKAYVVHTDAGFFAMTATCTHLGCRVRYDADANVFECPCHGGRYAADGRVLSGPPPRPLESIATRVDGARVVVKL